MNNDPTQSYQPGEQPPRPYEATPPTYGQPGPQPTSYPPQQPQQPYQQPQYGAPPPIGYPPQQPPKKSMRWLWITLGIIGGVIVLGCIGCGVTFALGVGFFAKTVLGPTTAANSYYQAIENKDYVKAYSYLDTSSISVQGQKLSEVAFVALAQSTDRLKGPVTSFSQTNITTGNNTATVTMSVTRNGLSYTVQLELQQTGNTWKITAFDNL